MIDSYTRPSCDSCKLIWGKRSLGFISHCTKCGRPITLKSYNPWKASLVGIAVIGIGCLTLLIPFVPIIWIGGFLVGLQMIYHGLKQWFDVKRLDADTRNISQEKSETEDSNHTYITCGNCSQKLRFAKGLGVVKVRCPKCRKEYAIRT